VGWSKSPIRRIDISKTIDIFVAMDLSTRTAMGTAQAVTRLKALADEKRLRIVALLAGGERCVCELQSELELAQPLLSFHLKKLREAGLVTDRRDGRWVHYSLDGEALGELRELLDLAHAPGPRSSRSSRCGT
jgi:ArsR family transcriptional regulator, arsenate/arsenite/antimonite-responsive transcriptional repressor